ncbi:MAG TPA: response regulator transcription factor [Sandaracinaceae bacterium LLY-WYZ-13_1]|nr:response regulator transcription factor [Sandaracinaceae bacterium LLY-WYZ-13_1]
MTETESDDGQRLLVVEDEDHLAAGLKLNLELEGYAVDVAGSAREAGERLLQPDGYDAIVLDVMLPDVDGFDLCKKIRKSGNYTPVIMLTARSAAEDRVRGLESGADDYLVKPFELDELLARVRSLMRRRRWERDDTPARASRVTFGRADVDFDSHEVEVEGERVKLTRLELDLLRYFVDHPGRVLSREELLEQVWKLRNYSSARTVDNFISRLRRHFELDPSKPKHFLSVRGAGYKFVP